jgi:hypothetical protein
MVSLGFQRLEIAQKQHVSNLHHPPWCSSRILGWMYTHHEKCLSCTTWNNLSMLQPQATHLASRRCDGFDVQIIHLGRTEP